MKDYPHLVWARETLRLGERFPLKAGLLTSLGFGHVSGLIAVVHPEAFVATLDEAEQENYRQRAANRLRMGNQRFLQSMCGGEPAYRRPANRRFDEAVDEHDAEAGLLLDPAVRLDSADTYGAGVGGSAR